MRVEGQRDRRAPGAVQQDQNRISLSEMLDNDSKKPYFSMKIPDDYTSEKIYEFVVHNPVDNRPIATGSFFAAEPSWVPSQVADLLSATRKVLSHRLQYLASTAIDGARVDVQRKYIPLLNPVPFSVCWDNCLVHSIELIVGGCHFFPSDLDQRVMPSPLHDDRSQRDLIVPFINQIVATDPRVRAAQVTGKAPRWDLEAYYDSDEGGSLRVALDVASDSHIMPMTSVTTKAILLLLLCALDFSKSGGGCSWSGEVELAPSASVRAQNSSTMLASDPARETEIRAALEYLKALGLDEVERAVHRQAISAVI